ncbi:MAG TPA: porphobilinogen synthase [Candidatus Ozemobacteraceae bacterium]|nr:porphobilinogen synthase [Candidatus Ozemobacteraceae bacterium]HQG27345.1 porphobilinogen synthase [Candidatus Ozemobacteraceae bacterium]
MSFPLHRPRRLRADSRIRALVRETHVRPESLILPLFVMEGINEPRPIQAMPGHFQWPAEQIDLPVRDAMANGVRSFLLFGIPSKKDAVASSAVDPDGIVPQALRWLKNACPDAWVITDVCLCAYTDHGHCGLLDGEGRIRNDDSLPVLAAMSLAHVRAGADMVAPSDMMDGRIGAIRKALDAGGFVETPIMAYAAKFASSFYGPFREAAHSAPQKGDRKGYQMDPANAREALREMRLDLEEGADVLMVKPGMPYLDILSAARREFDVPLAVYQVSGEFSMIKAAAARGWIDEKTAILESLTALRRAGADWILTYFAPEAAKWLREGL